MIKSSLSAVGHATRDLFRRRGALAILCALYFAALTSGYYFFAVGVATGGQLAASAVLALTAPLIFLLLQAAIANYAARDASTAGAAARGALRDFWKVLLVSLPVIALGVGLYYLLEWLQGRFAPPDMSAAPPVITGPRGTRPPTPLRWSDVLMSSLWLLSFGVLVPLLAAHLWLSVAAGGLKTTLKRFHRVVIGALAPRSVLIYVVGALFFGVLPYFIIFTRTPVNNGWLELIIFGLRLGLSFALTLWGWTITLAALAASRATIEEAAPSDETAVADEPQPEAAGA